MDGAVNYLPPSSSFRRGRAAIVKAHHDITRVRCDAMKVVIPRGPLVHYRLRRGFAIYENQDRIFFRWIEMGGLQHPGIQRDVVSDVLPKKFRGTCQKRRSIRMQLSVVL